MTPCNSLDNAKLSSKKTDGPIYQKKSISSIVFLSIETVIFFLLFSRLWRSTAKLRAATPDWRTFIRWTRPKTTSNKVSSSQKVSRFVVLSYSALNYHCLTILQNTYLALFLLFNYLFLMSIVERSLIHHATKEI